MPVLVVVDDYIWPPEAGIMAVAPTAVYLTSWFQVWPVSLPHGQITETRPFEGTKGECQASRTVGLDKLTMHSVVWYAHIIGTALAGYLQIYVIKADHSKRTTLLYYKAQIWNACIPAAPILESYSVGSFSFVGYVHLLGATIVVRISSTILSFVHPPTVSVVCWL